MKIKLHLGSSLHTFWMAGILTFGLYLLLYLTLKSDAYLFVFFYRPQSRLIQIASTYLFFVAVMFVIRRHRELNDEKKVAAMINVRAFSSVSFDTARSVLEKIPARYQHTIAFRRLSELLRGFLNREEIIRLNEELSRRDVDEADRGHLFLNSLRELIPILGFLGTVLGLSLGMLQFPEMMKTAVGTEGLKISLRELAGSLSTAFETTLLALGYTIIVMILASLLKRREEAFVSEVDRMAREILTKLKVTPAGASSAPTSGAEWDRILGNLQGALHEMGATLHADNEAILRGLENLRVGLAEPPHYEIRVSPLGKNNDG